jgi:hypothetical protein
MTAATVEARPAKGKEKRYLIEVMLANDQEPKVIFIGANGYDCTIERGKQVAVPESVINALNDAVMGVPEVVEDAKGNQTVQVVERKRFPFSVLGLA